MVYRFSYLCTLPFTGEIHCPQYDFAGNTGFCRFEGGKSEISGEFCETPAVCCFDQIFRDHTGGIGDQHIGTPEGGGIAFFPVHGYIGQLFTDGEPVLRILRGQLPGLQEMGDGVYSARIASKS